jgi:predicted ribosome quality control (RQC) complex YloA/Tae2 family protein
METDRGKPFGIPFDSLVLRFVTAELRSELVGGQIQDVRQPARDEIQLGIRSRGRSHLLTLSSHTKFGRVHLSRQRVANAPEAPTFCMALRKHISGGTILDVQQIGLDRIFEMAVVHPDDDGEPCTVRLIAEMMGKHSNLVLVSSNGSVIEAARRVSHRINRVRETLPGRPYVPPPAQEDRQDPRSPNAIISLLRRLEGTPSLSPDSLTGYIGETFTGFSPFLARQLALRAARLSPSRESISLEAVRTAWDEILSALAGSAYSPVVVKDASMHRVGAYPIPLILPPGLQQAEAPNLNFALDDCFRERMVRDAFETRLRSLLGSISRERAKLAGRIQSAERSIDEGGRADRYRQVGELIMANLWQIEPGQESLTVMDFHDPAGANVTIPLDPNIPAREHAESLFKRYRRAQEAQENALTLIVRLEEESAALTSLALRAEKCLGVSDIESLETEATRSGLLRKADTGEDTEAPDFEGHRIRRILTREGYEIYVGESATANDFLTTRLAGPNDIWLHARAIVSAHVVIKAKGKPELVPHSVLLEAAIACARHSAQKHSSLVPIDYTLRKFVRKPRGAAPGSVDYTREKTLEIRP